MKKLPPEIVEDLMNDNDFLSLDEAAQDEILGEIHRKLGITEPAENLLQRAAKVVQANMPINGQPQGGSPFEMGIGAVGSMVPRSYKMLEGIKEEAVNETTQNPLGRFALGAATDPLAYMGGGKAIKETGKGIAGIARNVQNPSKVFGESIGKLQSANPEGVVDFSNIISKAMNNPVAKKVIERSGVIEKYGGQNMGEGGQMIDKLANLPLQESQNLVNDIKVLLRQAVKEGTVRSNELGIAELLSELPKAQDAVFSGFKGVRRGYGFGKNVGKALDIAKKHGAKAAITGAAGTAAGTATYQGLKPFFGNK